MKEQKLVSMDIKYTYRNGQPARILCVDSGNSTHPVISIAKNGSTASHTLKGSFLSDISKSDWDLVEAKSLEDYIGELCWFWDDDATYYILANLTSIKYDSPVLYYTSISPWENCAPFKGELPLT